jgi:hypothetical protein
MPETAALNTGLTASSHPLVVMLDGDTVFEPDAVRILLQPFADPAVGAVSGNAKVANRAGCWAGGSTSSTSSASTSTGDSSTSASACPPSPVRSAPSGVRRWTASAV